MKALKTTIPPYNDFILPALKAIKRNPESIALNSALMEALAKAVEKCFPIYLNYQSIPEESYCFSIEETEKLLSSAPWPPGRKQLPGPSDNRQISGPSLKKNSGHDRELQRSKQGRVVVSTGESKIAFPELDFTDLLTKHRMAGIFETTENEIAKQLTGLVKKGIDVEGHSIPIGDQDSRKSLKKYYDPLIAFYIGYYLDTPRGDEFKQWFVELIYKFWKEKSSDDAECASLKAKLESTTNDFHSREAAIQEKDEAIAGMQSAISRLNQEIADKNRQIADLQNDLAAAGTWDIPKSVMEAKRIAEARYGSKLVFHARVDQAIDDFSLNQNAAAAISAACIFKALAENLHKSKFEKGTFSEEQFKGENGLVMSMTESKASKRDQDVWESRTCVYNGEKITYFPHVKDRIQGVEFRVHFQFLDQEGKIIVCHVGEHLLNARTRHMN